MKRFWATLMAMLIATVSLFPAPVSAFTDYWGVLSPSRSSDLLDIASNGRTFVAVGEQGVMVTSTDGVSWTPQSSGTDATLSAVTYGNGTFAAAGGKSAVLSVDGLTWRSAAVPTTGTLTSIIFADGTFTAADDNGKVFSSSDGSTWTRIKDYRDPISNPFTLGPKLQSLAYGGGMYVVMLPNGGTYTFGSRQTQSTLGWGSDCARALYLGGQFLMLCEGTVITGTTSGSRWDRRDPKTFVAIRDAVYDGRKYVAVGDGGLIETSPDGIAWTVQAKPRQAPDYNAIEYANGIYVTVGTYGRIWTSRDAVTWTEAYHGVQMNLSAAVAADGMLVAAGVGGTVISSPIPWPDRWTRKSTGIQQSLQGVARGNGLFVAVGAEGAVTTSADGKAWTAQTSGSKADLRSVVYGKDQFVAVGEAAGRAAVLTSANGKTWTARTTDLPGLNAVTYGQNRFVAVGAGGLIATSTDGSAWSRVESPAGLDLNGIAFGGGHFLAVGSTTAGAGAALSSQDGLAWSPAAGADKARLLGVTYGEGRFLAIGAGGAVGFSLDGTEVRLTPAALKSNVRGVTVLGGLLYVVGDDGVIQVWRLAMAAKSGLTVGSGPVKAGQEAAVTVKLADGDGHPLSNRTVTLIADAAAGDLLSPTATTDSSGAAQLRVRAPGSGSLTVNALTDDGLLLTQTVALVGQPQCGKRFPDVSAANPACQAIEQLSDLQVIKGTPDGFLPENGLTRAELATMLVRALKLKPLPDEKLAFTDVNGHWAAGAGFIQAAVRAKAFGGNPDGTFQPEGPVTRAQLVKVVAAAAGRSQGAPSARYTDITAADWYAGWVNTAQQGRLIGADACYPIFTGAEFQGDQAATRAEAAVLLANLLAQPGQK